MAISLSLLLTLFCASLAMAHDNGMDMSMDGSMALPMGQMLPYLHFTPGDMLWFVGWVPQSAGAMVGTCIGLFLLGIVERWIAACSAVMSAHWAHRAEVLRTNRVNAKGLPTSSSSGKSIPESQSSNSSTSTRAVLRDAVTMRSAPPFIASHDILRGVVYAGRSALQFAFMLAIMTFQVGFILSIVVGLGVGEVLFGRYISAASH